MSMISSFLRPSPARGMFCALREDVLSESVFERYTLNGIAPVDCDIAVGMGCGSIRTPFNSTEPSHRNRICFSATET